MTQLITNPDIIEDRHHKYLDVLGMVWVAVLIIGAFTSIKTFSLGPFVFSVAVIFYPITYIFADLFTEVYGYKKTRRVVWTGLFCMVLTSCIAYLYSVVTPNESFKDQAAFELIFKATPIVFVGYVLSFFAGEFSNSYVLAKMKVWTQGKHLWARLLGSTLVGQTADNGIGYVWACFLGGYFLASELPNLIFSTVLFCTLWEFIAMPITYRVTSFVKRAEGLDIYDTNTNFNPFHVGTGN
jgi:uncharacterized integral membrane protein (TIGR00697 family)